MKTRIVIVIIDINRYFAWGLEAVLKQYLIHRGHPQVVFSDSYDVNADLVFQSHNLSPDELCCRMNSQLLQHRIAILNSPRSLIRLPICFNESSEIRRCIKIEALLGEVERLLTSSELKHHPQNCPRCTLAFLTVRERQVLKAFCRERTPEQIAKEFKMSIKTVSTHKRGAMKKLGFTRSCELFHWLGWLRKGGFVNALTRMNNINSIHL